jgi:hypothetical protein
MQKITFAAVKEFIYMYDIEIGAVTGWAIGAYYAGKINSKKYQSGKDGMVFNALLCTSIGGIGGAALAILSPLLVVAAPICTIAYNIGDSQSKSNLR